jgi:hypothetical protein
VALARHCRLAWGAHSEGEGGRPSHHEGGAVGNDVRQSHGGEHTERAALFCINTSGNRSVFWRYAFHGSRSSPVSHGRLKIAALPGNALEPLRGGRKGQYSIRINDQ